jgi:hypothetical protein
MDGRNEHRVAIKFCFKAGLSTAEKLVLVQKAYGNETLNRWKVFMFSSRFRGVMELVQYYERDGRPKSTRTAAVYFLSLFWARLIGNYYNRVDTEKMNVVTDE